MLKILVVDDSKVARRRILNMLKSFDINNEVDEASDGKIALEKFNSTYNLVITDLEMPNMNGVELIKELRKFSSTLSIIMITTVANEQIKQILKAERFTSYIRKPIDKKILELNILKIKNHLSKVE